MFCLHAKQPLPPRDNPIAVNNNNNNYYYYYFLILNQQGRQFSQLLEAELCASAVVMLDTPCSEVV